MNCGTCGQSVERPKSRQLFCSHACRRTSLNARRRLNLPQRICAHCGRLFQPRLTKQRCCNRYCGIQLYKDEHPEYVERHRARAGRYGRRPVRRYELDAGLDAELLEWKGEPDDVREAVWQALNSYRDRVVAMGERRLRAAGAAPREDADGDKPRRLRGRRRSAGRAA